MTDKPASLDDITQYLDESGNLVGGVENWDDSEKLMHIKRELKLWLSELNMHLIWIEEELKEKGQELGSPSICGISSVRLREEYLQGRKEEIRTMQKYIRGLLYGVFRDNNNQKEEQLNG